MLEEFLACGRHHEASQETMSTVMLDFDRGIQKMEGATANALASKFDELIMFDEFTTGDYRAGRNNND